MTRQTRLGLGLSAAWGALLFAARDVLSIFPSPQGSSPLESFLFNTDATLPALHAALASLVFYVRREEIARVAARGAGAPLLAFGVAVLGWLALGWARASGQIDLQLDALVILTISAGLWIGGMKRLDLFAIPVSLLVLARPWPPMLAHHVHELLQVHTGNAVTALLSIFAPVDRSGHLMAFQGRLFEVVEGCSGLKIEISLLSAILVYAAFLSRSRRQTIGLVAISIVLGPIVNTVRVVAIMIDPSASIGQSHTAQGLVAIAFAVVLIALLDRWLETWLWPPRDLVTPLEDRAARPAEPEGSANTSRLIGLATTSAIAVAVGLWPATKPSPPVPEGWALHEIRPQMGAWKRVASRTIEPEFLGSVKFQSRLFWEYEREGGGRALVFAGVDNRRRRDYSGFSPKTRTLSRTWETRRAESVRLESLGVDAELAWMRAGSEWWTALHYRIAERSLASASLSWLFARDLWPGARASDLVTVRIAVASNGPKDPRARRDLFELQGEIATALQRAAPESARVRLGWSTSTEPTP